MGVGGEWEWGGRGGFGIARDVVEKRGGGRGRGGVQPWAQMTRNHHFVNRSRKRPGTHARSRPRPAQLAQKRREEREELKGEKKS